MAAMVILTDNRCLEYASARHPERPARVARTVERLQAQSEVRLQWAAPALAETAPVLRAHDAAWLEQLRAEAPSGDRETPAHPGMAEHALRAAGGALEALRRARAGQPAFSLLRPPGHHALRRQAMGYCYLNSMAIAALEAAATGAGLVAVFDFDVHHGNGTQEILLDQPDTVFFSVQQHPGYPDTGGEHAGGNCFNYPVPARAPRAAYREALARALADLEACRPSLIGVSAGFDAYKGDRLAQQSLEVEDYEWLGRELGRLHLPLFSILEGGYSEALPELVLAYLKGLESPSAPCQTPPA